MLVSRQFRLNRSKTLRFLDELATPASEGITVYIPPTPSQEQAQALLEKVPGAGGLPPDVPGLVSGSKTGAVLFWGPLAKYLVVPPFPVTEKYLTSGYDAGLLASMLKQEVTVALVLVRLGAYAVGVSRGEKLIASKVGTGLVHGRHRQGGSSAARFQRRRDDQIDHFLDRVCEHALEKIQPHANEVDYIVYGGAWTTILSLQKQCPFLRGFGDRALGPLLDIPKPNQATLESALERVWSCRITEWKEET